MAADITCDHCGTTVPMTETLTTRSFRAPRRWFFLSLFHTALRHHYCSPSCRDSAIAQANLIQDAAGPRMPSLAARATMLFKKSTTNPSTQPANSSEITK